MDFGETSCFSPLFQSLLSYHLLAVASFQPSHLTLGMKVNNNNIPKCWTIPIIFPYYYFNLNTNLKQSCYSFLTCHYIYLCKLGFQLMLLRKIIPTVFVYISSFLIQTTKFSSGNNLQHSLLTVPSSHASNHTPTSRFIFLWPALFVSFIQSVVVCRG